MDIEIQGSRTRGDILSITRGYVSLKHALCVRCVVIYSPLPISNHTDLPPFGRVPIIHNIPSNTGLYIGDGRGIHRAANDAAEYVREIGALPE